MKIAIAAQAITYAPAYIAQGLGYFKDEGVNVSFVPINGEAAHIAALNGGSVDADLDDPSGILEAINGGASLKILTSAGQANVYEWVVSAQYAKAHGLSQESSLQDVVKALKGATIGSTPPGGSVYTYTVASLRAAGLNPTTARIDTLNSGPAVEAAFEKGSVDAFLYVPPLTSLAQTRDHALVFPVSELGSANAAFAHTFNFSLVTTGSYLQSHSSALTGVIHAYYCAEQYALKNPDKALALVRPQVPTATPESLTLMMPSFRTSPVPTESSYSALLALIKLGSIAGGLSPVSVPYATAVDSSLATQAAALQCPAASS